MTLEQCADVLAQILSDPAAPAVLQIRVLELFFRLTTGWAPTRTVKVTSPAQADRFFGPDAEQRPPA